MGIQGLLPFVKNACHQINIKQFSGWTLCVDMYCFLHKGAFACAGQLIRGAPTDQYVYYCLKYINMLLSCGIKPILVFDGCCLPAKETTEKRRRQKREHMKKKGKQLYREGKLNEARDCFQQCVEVTPQMAHEVIIAAREIGVDCIVAPYEADAQLAYLCKTGIAQCAVTEDSDMIVFGCNMVVFKLDLNGNCFLYEKSRLGRCFGPTAQHFTFEKFRRACIMSGCDYLSSLPGIGLQKAMKVFKQTRNPNLRFVLTKISSYLNMPTLEVTDEYIEMFIRAENTFLYQVVFDPLKRLLVPINVLPNDLDVKNMSYAGPYFDKQFALDIAVGNVDVITMMRIDNYNPDCRNLPISKSHTWCNVKTKGKPAELSIWDKNYMPKGQFAETVQPMIEGCAPKHKEDTQIQKIDKSSNVNKRKIMNMQSDDASTFNLSDLELAAAYRAPDFPYPLAKRMKLGETLRKNPVNIVKSRFFATEQSRGLEHQSATQNKLETVNFVPEPEFEVSRNTYDQFSQHLSQDSFCSIQSSEIDHKCNHFNDEEDDDLNMSAGIFHMDKMLSSSVAKIKTKQILESKQATKNKSLENKLPLRRNLENSDSVKTAAKKYEHKSALLDHFSKTKKFDWSSYQHTITLKTGITPVSRSPLSQSQYKLPRLTKFQHSPKKKLSPQTIL